MIYISVRVTVAVIAIVLIIHFRHDLACRDSPMRAQVFQKQTGVDLGNAKDGDKKKKALNKLRTAAAQLKVDLSRMNESDICLDELFQVQRDRCWKRVLFLR
jgi:hypothetical protein